MTSSKATLLVSAAAAGFALSAPARAQDQKSDLAPHATRGSGVSTTAAAATAAAQPAPATAAADNPPNTNTDQNAIVVTGIRASLQSAQQIKRNSEALVDSIVAQDIGKLPDNTVSDALQRAR